jgi:DegV family protein with EDD domain
MSNIKITCDSTCDLPHELYTKYDVDVIALSVALGDTLHRDGVDITAPELFDYVKESGTLPKTSAVSMGEYMDVFGKYVDEGRTVIHINLSSNLSASHQNAVLAAQELGNVYVVDSQNLSTGSGHLVVEAAEMAAQGLDAETIVARLNEMKERLDVSFVLQTLEYLQKGGRVSKAVAIAGGMLSIKPIIAINAEGKIEMAGKARGNKQANALMNKKAQELEIDFSKPVMVGYTGTSDALLQKYLAESAEFFGENTYGSSIVSAVVGTHAGPNAVALAFFSK